MKGSMSLCKCGKHPVPGRKRITIDITGLLEGTNHSAVQALLDGLTARELKALAMKVHGALYRKLETLPREGERPLERKQYRFPWLDTLGYPRGW